MGACMMKQMINNHMDKFSEMERRVCHEAVIEGDGSIVVPFQQADGYFAQNISQDMLDRTGLTISEYRHALAKIGQHLHAIIAEKKEHFNRAISNVGSMSYAMKNQYKTYDMAANAQKYINNANNELFKLNTEFANRELGMRWILTQGPDRIKIRIQFAQANGTFDQSVMAMNQMMTPSAFGFGGPATYSHGQRMGQQRMMMM